MANGRLTHQERQGVLSLFGKDLARRAKSKCEICETSRALLFICEIEHVSSEPNHDHCLMLCETCTTQLKNPITGVV